MSDILTLSDKIQKDLMDTFGKQSAESLPVLCSQVDEYIVFQLTPRSIVDSLRDVAAKAKEHFATDDTSLVTFGNGNYDLRVVPHPSKPEVLQIVLIHITSPHLPRQWSHIKFDSLGRSSQLWLRVDERLDYLQGLVVESAQTTLEAGYRWLAAYVLSYLDAIRTDASTQLYTAIRMWLPRPIAGNVWLSAVIESRSGVMKTLYIPDGGASAVALSQAAQRNLQDRRSPLEHVAQFTTDFTDFTKTFSFEAIKGNRIISRKFALAGYSESGIQIAEQAIYRASAHTIQPLVSEGKTLLVAAYPASLEAQIAPILESKRAQIKEILQGHLDSLSTTVKKLVNRGVLPALHAKWFECAGAFLRGYTG